MKGEYVFGWWPYLIVLRRLNIRPRFILDRIDRQRWWRWKVARGQKGVGIMRWLGRFKGSWNYFCSIPWPKQTNELAWYFRLEKHNKEEKLQDLFFEHFLWKFQNSISFHITCRYNLWIIHCIGIAIPPFQLLQSKAPLLWWLAPVVPTVRPLQLLGWPSTTSLGHGWLST